MGAGSTVRKESPFHYSGGSVKRNGVFDAVDASLKASGLSVVYLDGVVPNPRLSLVRKGIELCKKEKIDLILAVGGGSVIDSAKAIGLGAKLPSNEDIWNDYFMNYDGVARETIPVGVVLTIPAAGSESSTGSVITDEQTKLKRAMNSETIIPKFAFMDRDHYSLCLSDRMELRYSCHLQERYFTTVSITIFLIAFGGMHCLSPTLRCSQNPNEYRYRAELMDGTLQYLLDKGRIGDWARHNIEHELSGMYDIAHGRVFQSCSAWMRYVSEPISTFVNMQSRVGRQSRERQRRNHRDCNRTSNLLSSLGLR